MDDYGAFLAFMIEYADFFDEMVSFEQEKLDALLSYELKRIEQSIASQQAVAMQLSNLEKRRAELQSAAGFADMTFREIIAATQDSRRAEMEALFDRIGKAIEEVKECNKESMDFVQMNLQTINGGTAPENRAEAQVYTAAARTPSVGTAGISVFETKI